MEKLKELTEKEDINNARISNSIFRVSLANYFLDKYGEEVLIDYYRNELQNHIKFQMGKMSSVLIGLAKKLGDMGKTKILEGLLTSLLETLQ